MRPPSPNFDPIEEIDDASEIHPTLVAADRSAGIGAFVSGSLPPVPGNVERGIRVCQIFALRRLHRCGNRKDATSCIDMAFLTAPTRFIDHRKMGADSFGDE